MPTESTFETSQKVALEPTLYNVSYFENRWEDEDQNPEVLDLSRWNLLLKLLMTIDNFLQAEDHLCWSWTSDQTT